jgi:hypothetical protein
VKTSRESVGSARSRPTRSRDKALERRTIDLPQVGREKRRKEGAGKPVPRRAGKALWRGVNAQESIGSGGPRSTGVRIFAGSKALESRGMVIFWSSEQENAMPETARGQWRRKAYGSAEGKRSAG